MNKLDVTELKRESKQLHLLSILYYAGGFTACIYFFAAPTWVSDWMAQDLGDLRQIAEKMYIFYIIFSIFFVWLLFINMFIVGILLTRRKNRLFCLFLAGVLILFFPVGTILGMITIRVLKRPSVIALFNG